jgi:hypothetical protein
MKKLDTSAITNTVAFPVKSGTLDFLQQSYQEGLTNTANSLIGGKSNASLFYVFWGCVNTGSGLNYIISAGAIYNNGELFLVDAVTFTAAAGQLAVGAITTTFYSTNADPVTFSDAISRNVHQIRKIVFASGSSGSRDVDFPNLVGAPNVLLNDQQATLNASYVAKFTQDRAVFFASATVNTTITFDFTNAVPGVVVRLKWTFGAGLTLTVTQGTGQTVIKDGGDATQVANANNLFYAVYLGKNAAGNDEISYTLKQV